MPDEPDPPRKYYGFKPPESERANATPDESPPSDTPAPGPDPGISAADTDRIDVNDLIRAGAGSGRQLGSNSVVNRDNEVHGILRDNLARANAAGLNELSAKPRRKSRRKRDYFLLMGGMNGFLLTMYWLVQNPVEGVFCLAASVFFSASLTWVMWFVMGDY
jgi:hypothetical protein